MRTLGFLTLRPFGSSMAGPSVTAWIAFAWTAIFFMALTEASVWALIGRHLLDNSAVGGSVLPVFAFCVIFALIWIVDASFIMAQRPLLRRSSNSAGERAPALVLDDASASRRRWLLGMGARLLIVVISLTVTAPLLTLIFYQKQIFELHEAQLVEESRYKAEAREAALERAREARTEGVTVLIKQAEDRRDNADAEIMRLREEIAQASAGTQSAEVASQIAALDKLIAEKQAEAEREKTGATGFGEGCGTRCKALLQEATELRAKRFELRERATQATEAQLAEREEALERLEADRDAQREIRRAASAEIDHLNIQRRVLLSPGALTESDMDARIDQIEADLVALQQQQTALEARTDLSAEDKDREAEALSGRVMALRAEQSALEQDSAILRSPLYEVDVESKPSIAEQWVLLEEIMRRERRREMDLRGSLVDSTADDLPKSSQSSTPKAPDAPNGEDPPPDRPPLGVTGLGAANASEGSASANAPPGAPPASSSAQAQAQLHNERGRGDEADRSGHAGGGDSAEAQAVEQTAAHGLASSNPLEIFAQAGSVAANQGWIRAAFDHTRSVDGLAQAVLLMLFLMLLALKLFEPRAVRLYYSEELQHEWERYLRGAFDHLPGFEPAADPDKRMGSSAFAHAYLHYVNGHDVFYQAHHERIEREHKALNASLELELAAHIARKLADQEMEQTDERVAAHQEKQQAEHQTALRRITAEADQQGVLLQSKIDAFDRRMAQMEKERDQQWQQVAKRQELDEERVRQEHELRLREVDRNMKKMEFDHQAHLNEQKLVFERELEQLRLEQQNSRKVEQGTRLQNQLQTLDEQRERRAGRFGELQAEHEQVGAELAGFASNAAMRSAKKDKIEAQTRKLRDELDGYERALKGTDPDDAGAFARLSRECSGREASIQELERRLDTARAEDVEAEKTKAALQARRAAIEAELAEQRQQAQADDARFADLNRQIADLDKDSRSNG